MSIPDSYAHGVFNWVDLATSDAKAAQTFYGGLFGWQFKEMPVPDRPPYTMAFHQGRAVTAICSLSDNMPTSSQPPQWQSYINVNNIEQCVEAWIQAGGKILMPPFPVMEYGDMAVVQDPTDAVVNLWQAKSHHGAGIINEPNTYCWSELQTRGADKAVAFYQSVFDWETEVDEKPPNYVICKVNGNRHCGIFDMDKAQLPPEIPVNWSVYFNVENLADSMEKVKALGGKVLMEPIEVDPGPFTTILDPQGATLTLIQLREIKD